MLGCADRDQEGLGQFLSQVSDVPCDDWDTYQ